MSAASFGWSEAIVLPHAAAVALCGARLLPVAFLCPLLGGPLAPMPVRLGLVLSLALALHFEGGVQAPREAVQSLWTFGCDGVREVGLGTALGLIAALPMDAARMGGRFLDVFRGASAEAALPSAGTRESATGNLLHPMLCAVLSLGALLPCVLPPLWRSFAWVGLGRGLFSERSALGVVGALTRAMGTGLAVGAPLAGGALAVDCAVGLAARALPQLHLQEVGTPLKLLGGAALIWLVLGLVLQRLMVDGAGLEAALLGYLEHAR